MKPKTNRKGDPNASQPMDRCYTPSYALDPLVPYLRKSWRIWEPAAGRGHLVSALEQAGHTVTATELQTLEPWDRVCSELIGYGVDFFASELVGYSAIVTNPPYSIKPEWIERCYQLGKPFALLVPVETIGGARVHRLMEQFGAELLLLDKRVNFIMPNAGLSGGGAQFPVLWLCWRMLPRPIVYGKITRRADEQMHLLEVST